MNRYPFNSENIIYNQYPKTFLGLIVIITFFSYGLFYTVYLYIVKYSKTIYRCLLFGFCQIILDFTMIFSNGLNLRFDKNMFFITIASIIGFVNAYFVNQDFDDNIISDYRKMELKTKSSSKLKIYNESF